jgi:hypothetical protein
LEVNVELVSAYVRADFPEIQESEFDELARSLAERIASISRDFASRVKAKDELDLIYDLDQGSLINIAKVFGALMATYVFISQYPNFRNGVIQIYEDARAAGESIVQEFKNVTGIKERSIRYERTTPRDVNRLLRIIQNVENPSGEIPESVRRDAIIADLARLHRQNPDDPTIQRVIDIIPKDQAPPIPRRLEDILALDERRRRRVAARREAAGRFVAPAGRRLPSVRRLHFHSTFRI